MLHAKFQDHITSGSGEEDFLRFLPIWAWPNKFGFDWPSGFGGDV